MFVTGLLLRFLPCGTPTKKESNQHHDKLQPTVSIHSALNQVTLLRIIIGQRNRVDKRSDRMGQTTNKGILRMRKVRCGSPTTVQRPAGATWVPEGTAAQHIGGRSVGRRNRGVVQHRPGVHERLASYVLR